MKIRMNLIKEVMKYLRCLLQDTTMPMQNMPPEPLEEDVEENVVIEVIKDEDDMVELEVLSPNSLAQKLKDWGVTHFKDTEIVTLHNSRWTGARYLEPTSDVVDNIKDTVILAEKIRLAWGSGVRVLSGWRPVEYNRLVDSNDTSEHVQFRALDLTPSNGKYDDFVECVRKVVAVERQAGVNIGVGLYPKSRFVHIDTNAEGKRKNREW